MTNQKHLPLAVLVVSFAAAVVASASAAPPVVQTSANTDSSIDATPTDPPSTYPSDDYAGMWFDNSAFSDAILRQPQPFPAYNDNGTEVPHYTSEYYPDTVDATLGLGFSPVKHVPIVRQVSVDTAEIIVSHAQDEAHHIDHVLVLDGDGDVVFGYNLTVDMSKASVVFPLPDTDDGLVLTPYEWCNVHGRWVGDPVPMLSESAWENTVAACEASGEDVMLDTSTIIIDENRNISVTLVDDDEDETGYVDVTFHLMHGGWIGFGVGNEMVSADLMLVRFDSATQGYSCVDAHVRSKEWGPVEDTRYGGENNAETISVQVSDGGHLKVECRRPVESSDDCCDKLVDPNPSSYIYAFGDGIDVTYHGVVNRYVVSLDLNNAQDIVQSQDDKELIYMHGIAMAIIWTVLIPFGAAIVRYQKHCVWWLGAHRFIQTMGTVITLPLALLAFQGYVQDHYAHPHSIIGLAITAASSLTAMLGVLMLRLSKLSNRIMLHIIRDTTVPGDLRKKLHTEVLTVHQCYEHERPRIYAELSADKVAHLERSQAKYLASHASWIDKWLVPVLPYKYKLVNPAHRWIGRSLVILALVQAFLGMQLLSTGSCTVLCRSLTGWAIMLGLFVIYKEIELWFKLPRGVFAKLHLFVSVSFCRSKNNTKGGSGTTYSLPQNRRSVEVVQMRFPSSRISTLNVETLDPTDASGDEDDDLCNITLGDDGQMKKESDEPVRTGISFALNETQGDRPQVVFGEAVDTLDLDTDALQVSPSRRMSQYLSAA